MKILVAGGAGFIPSHLVDYLLGQGHSVSAMDNLVTGQAENLAHLKENPRFRFHQGDITQAADIPTEPFDQIYNMASPASPVDFKRIPLQILYTGAFGQKNLLEKAQKDGSRILFASTSEVYGDPLIHPQVETYYGNVNCIGERSCYDEAKRFGEALSMSFHRVHNVDIRLLRIFNTFGPRMRPDDGRVIPNFFMQALRGQGLTVYGDGQQTRSLCFVSDMVRGIEKLMNTQVDGPVNVGNDLEMTILQIADLINEICGNKTPHRFMDLPENDPKVRQPDITRAKEILGWSPEVEVRKGLLETMEFFKKYI